MKGQTSNKVDKGGEPQTKFIDEANLQQIWEMGAKTLQIKLNEMLIGQA